MTTETMGLTVSTDSGHAGICERSALDGARRALQRKRRVRDVRPDPGARTTLEPFRKAHRESVLAGAEAGFLEVSTVDICSNRSQEAIARPQVHGHRLVRQSWRPRPARDIVRSCPVQHAVVGHFRVRRKSACAWPVERLLEPGAQSEPIRGRTGRARRDCEGRNGRARLSRRTGYASRSRALPRRSGPSAPRTLSSTRGSAREPGSGGE